MTTDPPLTGPEWHQLAGYLDHLRSSFSLRTSGLTDEGMHAHHPPSSMTLGGLLSHLAFEEDYWFGYVWAGREPPEPWRSAEWGSGTDWEWRMAEELGAGELRALWRDAVARSDTGAQDPDLDGPTARPVPGGPVSRRWVALHMIEEYARHCGHAELIREAVDAGVAVDAARPGCSAGGQAKG